MVPVVYTLLLAAPSVTLPGDDLGIRRFQTPAVGPYMRLGQTFTMTADGLRAIEVFPVPVGGRVSGNVRFDLYEVYDLGSEHRATLVRSAEIPAEELVKASSYRFEFAPIVDSEDRTYRLDFTASPGESIAFWATKGKRYDRGTMHANGRDRWADLAFQVDAPAPSVWGGLMTLRETNPVRASLVIAAFLALWFLLGLVLRGIAAIPDDAAGLRELSSD